MFKHLLIYDNHGRNGEPAHVKSVYAQKIFRGNGCSRREILYDEQR